MKRSRCVSALTVPGAVFGLLVARLRLGTAALAGAGVVWGAVVFALSAFIGLPIAAPRGQHPAAMSHQLFDPGLQPERTELAWRRTTLALIVGALVALRLLPPALGSWSIIVGLAGPVVAAIIWVLAH